MSQKQNKTKTLARHYGTHLSVLGRLRQKDWEFKTTLGFTMKLSDSNPVSAKKNFLGNCVERWLPGRS
jgi:hypothetical protein